MELETLIKSVAEKSKPMIKTVVKESKVLYSKFVNFSHARKIAIYLIFSVFAIIIGLGASGVRFAYNVNYGGEVIATVKNKTQFDDAVKLVKQKVNSFEMEVEEAVENPSYEATVVLSGAIDSEDAVADAIIANTEKIAVGYDLIIDGEVVACLENDKISSYIENRKNSFTIESAKCVCKFEKSVELVKTYVVKEKFDSVFEAKLAIDAIPVRCVATVVSDVAIPNKVINEKTGTMLRGDSQVLVEGSEGLRRVTQTVVTVNGEESARITVSNVTLSQPVDRVVKVGTAISIASAKEQLLAENSGFICPVPAGKFTISAYYGDGRNHKGLDFAAKKGTSIFAVAEGTVTFSGWNGGYGYLVVIDHGNGYVTKYGHASKLLVSKGERVVAGQVIAEVGTTGNSTGNHLHFEVLINGVNYNPAPFVKIK